MRRLIIGCGYLGERVARRWLEAGETVYAVTRSTQRAAEFEQAGMIPVVADVMQPAALDALPDCECVLHAVGFDRSSSYDKRALYVEGLKNVLQRLPDSVARLFFISSTSVYGQQDGEWVDETSACEPTSEGGQICLEAETLIRKRFAGNDRCRAVILRPSGLYGPGRLLARTEQLRSGVPLRGNPEAWLNLVHIDDVAQAVILAANAADPAETYLVSDTQPLRRADYYSRLAALVDAPPPVFADAAASEGSPLNKRCCSKKICEELNLQFRYPSVKEGLPHAVGIADRT
ncbi:short chain dehydrogenase [Maioricimonas rarisocia]|uniref:Short chain dehydrogenase n=1 Tax=Maioricimonas rarisocia TaxID=2528026 RepID=A0A517Z2P9_9PLAN|nr:SDR family oxidoreductase [Maioricimonas rarisocia]QDU36752.1 short chain dehydrogenase [Maioricimonas rarisocia]